MWIGRLSGPISNLDQVVNKMDDLLILFNVLSRPGHVDAG